MKTISKCIKTVSGEHIWKNIKVLVGYEKRCEYTELKNGKEHFYNEPIYGGKKCIACG